jgi:L-ascorbate metabolism protein UlaG (beta-lactamase superfamily)
MEITYFGRSCFKITGKKINILIDPFSEEKVKAKLPKQDADVVLVTHPHSDHNNLKAMKSEDYLLLDSPGEYEIRETEIQGIASRHGGEFDFINTIFTMDVEGVKIAHLGDLGTELSSEQLDKMDGVDVLMIPVGGKFTIDAKEAVKVISQVEPKVVIPMHFRDAGNAELAPLEDFLHEMSVEPVSQDKLKLTVKDLPQELEVIKLKV